jgi:hypothetical protein
MSTRAQRLREADTISPEQWRAARERENERDTHACDVPDFKECVCQGACSCHWVAARLADDELVNEED